MFCPCMKKNQPEWEQRKEKQHQMAIEFEQAR